MRWFFVLIFPFIGAGFVQAQDIDVPALPLAPRESTDVTLPEEQYTSGAQTEGGTGRYFMGREIADVTDPRGVAWMERPEREDDERPLALINALDLEPTDVVADIGAGTGYFTLRIAPRVPEGRVLAVDISQEMLAIIEARAEEAGFENVSPVWGTATDPQLHDGSVDVSLIVNSYHEFSHPREMLEAIYRGTKTGGRLVIVEYRGEDPDIPIQPIRTMTEEQARREVTSVGFRFVENLDVLPQQHVLVFEK